MTEKTNRGNNVRGSGKRGGKGTFLTKPVPAPPHSGFTRDGRVNSGEFASGRAGPGLLSAGPAQSLRFFVFTVP